MMKNITLSIAMFLLCLTMSAQLTIQVNGGAPQTGTSLENAIANAGFSSSLGTITQLEVTAGDFTTADWEYVKNNNGLDDNNDPITTGFTTLTTFTIADGITSVGDMPDAIFRGNTVITTVSIPKVTTTAIATFLDCSALTTVSFPQATSIGIVVFSSCMNLTTVNIPLATSIGDNAFYECRALTEVNFPLVTSIGGSAFAFCNLLMEADFPLVTSIGGNAFQYCEGMTTATFPQVTSIGDNAFKNCSVLTTLRLGATPPTVGGTNAFLDTPTSRSLVLVDAMGDPLFIGSEYDTAKAAYDPDNDGLWYGWTIAPAATLPLTIQVNGTTAGTGPSLEAAITSTGVALGSITQLEVTAGDFITADWNYLRNNKFNLNTLANFTVTDGINTVANIPGTFLGYPYFNESSITTVSVAKVTSIGNDAFSGCSALSSASFPQATSIGYSAFSDCSALTSASFPQATSIGNYAFDSCDALTSASFPQATSIGGGAFNGCGALTSASFPQATSIGGGAFFYCSDLATLQLGTTVPSVGSNAFGGSLVPDPRNLVLVDATGNPLMAGSAYDTAKAAYDAAETPGDGKWYGWTIAPAATLPLTIQVNGTTAGTGATLEAAIANAGFGSSLGTITQLEVTAGDFEETDWNYLQDNRFNLNTLANFTITDGINTVADIPNAGSTVGGFYPYFNESSITMVSVAKVNSIGEGTFQGCSALISVSFPQATSIGRYVFSGCTALTTASFPRVNSIDDDAFNGCGALTSASFPQATSIGSYAFGNCSALATLQLGTTPPTVGANAFNGTPDPRNLVLVDAMGNPLMAGSAYDTAKAAYDAAGTPDGDGLWYGWTIADAVSCMTLSLTQTDVSTTGGNDGELTVTATDGTAPYTYAWSNGETTQTITGLTAGTYTVTVTDDAATPCVATASATITEPIPLQFTTQPATSSQTVQQNATATALSVAVTGGESPYSYQWYSNTTASNTGGTAIAGATSASYTPSTATAGTTYYYAVVTDSDNTSITSNVSGAVTVTAIPYAKALDFDGTDDRVSIPSNTANNITGTQITLEAKIKVDQFRPNAYQGGIIVKEGNQEGYMIRVGGNGVVNFNLGNGSWNELDTDANTLTTGQWYHIAATYDGATQKIYVNGQLVKSVNKNFSIASTSNALGIGNWTAGNPDRGFNGIIDEVRIWDVARTPAQINQFKNNELPASEQNANLRVYYQLNQGIANANNSTVTSVYNEVSGANEGSLENFTLDGPTSNWVIDTDVDPAIPAFEYVTQPSTTAQSVEINTAATALSVAVTGGVSPYSYQWYSNTTASNTGGTVIAGATSASYTPSTTTVGTTYYYVVASDNNGTNITSDVSGGITVTAPPCTAPTDLVATDVTETSVNLGFTSSATAWEIEYGASGFAQGSGTTVSNVTSNPYALTGLMAATTYDFYVREVGCTGVVWSVKGSFMTTTPPPCDQGYSDNRIYVNASATGTADGKTWATAYTDLQDAIDKAVSCNSLTEIWVAGGTYKPSKKPRDADRGTPITTSDARDVTFHLIDGVKLYGGFAGTEAALADRDLSANTTTLSGDLGTAGDNTDNAYHVVVSVSDGATTVLDGFIITDGNANYNSGTTITVEGQNIPRYRGGGMYNDSSSPSITNVTFSGNRSNESGGGMSNTTSSSPTITNVTFSGNTASDGGGMYTSYSSSPSITNVTFSGNTASNNGGGMYNILSSPSITNVTFSGNTASNNGGGMFNDSSAPSITNVTFSGNTASYGGGMFNSSSSPSMTNVTFSGNTASAGGGGMFNESSSPNIYNSIFWGNKKGTATNVAGADIENLGSSPTVEHCLTQENSTYSSGTGIINNQDPLFVDAANPAGADGIFGTADDGLVLQAGSPAIDAGDNTKVPAGITTDITGAARIQGGTVDMGAYEITLAPPCDQGYSNNRIYVNASATGTADGKAWATAYTDLQDAIDKAVSCNSLTEIWVAAGTYKPSEKPRDADRGTPITTGDAKDVTFHLIDGIKIYGGFAGTEAALADRDLSANTTTLSGDIGTAGDNTDNAYHVVISISDGATTVLDGFTITGANANGSGTITVETKTIYRSYGGGISNYESSPSITNVTFSGNTASAGGGGMLNNSSSPSITNVTFSGNTANSDGGGMYNYSSSPSITNVTFSGNTASSGGGMANSSSSSPSMTNVTFSGNTASSGGGMRNSSSSPSMTNVTFSGNTANSTGGGMANYYSSPKIYNSIFWGNQQGTATNVVGADIENNGGTPTVEHCLTQENSTYSSGTGIINNQDPLFVDAANPAGADGIFGTADDGLRLQCASPAINAGNNAPSGVTMPSTDITGAARQQGGTVDMGAYESSRTGTLATSIAETTLPTAAGMYYSERTITDGNIKHYCTCDNELLLSLGDNSNVPDDGVSLKIGATPVTHYAQGVGFINNPNGASLMNRTWNAAPTTQPSGEVVVRYYYTAADYAAINTSLTDNGGTALTGVEQMQFYKVTKPGEHLAIADIASNEVIVLDHGTTPSTTVWQSGSLGTDHYAEFSVSSFSGGGGGASSAGQSLLPVEMIYFTATKDGDDVRLDWATASEVNNEGFDVERSIDGRRFETIGYVQGSGTTIEEMTYDYMDTDANSGINYYRLKQMDYDGGYEYSNIVAVRLDGKSGYSIYPNPTADVLYINQKTDYSIINGQGQLVKKGTADRIDVSKMQPGLYQIRLGNGNIERFIKM